MTGTAEETSNDRHTFTATTDAALGPYLMTIDIKAPQHSSSELSYVGRWFKEVGDTVTLHEPIVEIETVGTTLEVPAPATGVLSSITLTDGQSVRSGDRLGTIAEY